MEKVSLSPRPQKRHPHSLHYRRLHSRRTSPTRMSTRQTTKHREDAEPFSEAPSRSTLHLCAAARPPCRSGLRAIASPSGQKQGVMCNHKVGLHGLKEKLAAPWRTSSWCHADCGPVSQILQSRPDGFRARILDVQARPGSLHPGPAPATINNLNCCTTKRRNY